MPTTRKRHISGQGFLLKNWSTQSPLQALEVCNRNFRTFCVTTTARSDLLASKLVLHFAQHARNAAPRVRCLSMHSNFLHLRPTRQRYSLWSNVCVYWRNVRITDATRVCYKVHEQRLHYYDPRIDELIKQYSAGIKENGRLWNHVWFLTCFMSISSIAVEQVVACAPVTQRVRVRSPVWTSFLGEVFSGVFLACKTNVGKL